jgi:DNA-binding response OmpR family regulator
MDHGGAPATPAILIVDDEPGITATLADLLVDEGYQVATARDGPGAVAALADLATPPALLLLDVMLPGVSGLAVCRQLRSAPEMRDVPVVFITVVPPDWLLEHLDDCPGASILPKPFRFAELLDAVHRHVAPPAGDGDGAPPPVTRLA